MHKLTWDKQQKRVVIPFHTESHHGAYAGMTTHCSNPVIHAAPAQAEHPVGRIRRQGLGPRDDQGDAEVGHGQGAREYLLGTVRLRSTAESERQHQAVADQGYHEDKPVHS